MTKISRKRLSSDKTGSLIEQLWRAVTLLENKQEVHAFLYDILTRTELQMLAKRLEIAKMLEEGNSYYEIKKDLHVTDSTIAKINNWSNAFGSGFAVAIRRLHDLESKRTKHKSFLSGQQTVGRAALRVGIGILHKSYKKQVKRQSAIK